MKGSDLSPDARYAGAWTEIQMRVSARDTLLTQYLLALVAILGVAINQQYRMLAIAVPYTVLVVSLLLAHHDHIIDRLTRYLHGLVADQKLAGIDWFSKEDGVFKAIRIGTLTYTVAVVMELGIPCVIAFAIIPTDTCALNIVRCLSLAAGILAVGITLSARSHRFSWLREVERKPEE